MLGRITSTVADRLQEAGVPQALEWLTQESEWAGVQGWSPRSRPGLVFSDLGCADLRQVTQCEGAPVFPPVQSEFLHLPTLAIILRIYLRSTEKQD